MDVAVIRVEQLYPLHVEDINAILKAYEGAELVWLQEEPANMGAWSYIQQQLAHLSLRLISRKTAASPATGYKKLHDENQARIITEAIT
jgi:2-oxoglutarate dehydrogenase E1 component